MADKMILKVNGARDAVADATAMVWAIFYMAQGMRQDEIANALMGCCNQALARLRDSTETLEAIAAAERAKDGV